MYTFFTARKNIFSKFLGVLMIVAVIFPTSAVAPRAFAEGEPVVDTAVSVEVLPVGQPEKPTEEVAPAQTKDEVLVEDNNKEETLGDKAVDENGKPVMGYYVAIPELTAVSQEVLGASVSGVDMGEAEQCPAETLTIQSDGSETYGGGSNNAVATWVHPNWITIPGAQWIWDSFNVSDPTNDQTQTFERNFVIPGVAQAATLQIASDNSYKVSVNSNTDVFSDALEDNYSAVDTYAGDISNAGTDLVDYLNEGGNTLNFEVKNWAQAGASAESNPAGLTYQLDVTYIPTDCKGNGKDEGTITVTKVVANSNEPVSSFPLFVSGTPVVSGIPATFDAGVYTVTETNLPNFIASFSGACNANGEITLNKDQDLNCTVTNTYVPPATPAYCGDNIVNQPWEQCDGSASCTAQCQFEGQCVDKAFAKVTIDNVANLGGASGMTPDVYVGGSSVANKIPSGTWFLIHDGVNPIVDTSAVSPDQSTGYINVPGLAVERRNGEVFLGIYGGYASSSAKEHVDGKLEFFNTSATGQTTGTNNPKVEGAFNGTGFGGYADTNDEVRLNGGVSEFSMTTNHNSDGFETQYAPVAGQCAEITVVKHVVNDSDNGSKVASDFTMHLDSASGPYTFAGSETGTTYSVNAGAYSVSESSDFGGYTGSMSSDCSGTLAVGESKTCTVTNDDSHYSAYCGDNIVNQPWEQCDGSASCTAQCQFEGQCTEKAFARVNVTNVTDTNTVGTLTSDIFVGGTNSNALVIPQGAWFMIFDGTNTLIDNRTNGSGYFNVPGIAVQRIKAGGARLLTGIFGQNNESNNNIKHAEGNIEFFNTSAASITDGPGSMHLENGFDTSGFGGLNHADDEVYLNSGVSYFSLGTSSQGDAFATYYAKPQSCSDDDGGDNGSGTNGAGGSGSGGTGGGGAVILPSDTSSPTVLGASIADPIDGAGGAGETGQVLGESLAQTGVPLSFPMILSVFLAIATIVVTRKEKFI